MSFTPQTAPTLLGIEGGGTRTSAVMVDGEGKEIGRVTTGPANQRILSESGLAQTLRRIAAQLPRPDAIGIGLAGGWEEADWRRIEAVANRVWRSVPCKAANDLEIALLSAHAATPSSEPKVLVLSGTGSCCYSRWRNGEVVKVGGWGHILGDQGSGYDLALTALRRVTARWDRTGEWPKLGTRLLAALSLNTANELIEWAQQASAADVASLAPILFAAGRDPIATGILREAAEQLAADAEACASRLAGRQHRVEFVLAGGLLAGDRGFATLVKRRLLRRRPAARFQTLEQGALPGALELAKRAWLESSRKVNRGQPPPPSLRSAEPPRPRSARLSPTEERNPRSSRLDESSIRNAIRLMLTEEAGIPRALLKELPRIERVVRVISTNLRKGGRLFYVGAGTSGRLGVLDASECPPTFQSDPDRIQGIIAGGREALWRSIEGAEDDWPAGEQAVSARRVGRHDTVVGIAASGTTPFVWGALRAAKARRAATVLLCFNPYLHIPSVLRPDIVLTPNTGPEVLTGSTRLKAGTATKLLLNIFTTLSMVQLGKVKSNLMVEVNASNMKLRQRAVRIVCQLTGADPASARATLERNGWRVRAAAEELQDQAPLRGEPSVGQ